jgi:hypothetical protein
VHRSSRDIDDLVRAAGSNPHADLRIAEYLTAAISDNAFSDFAAGVAVGTEATATLLLGCELSFYSAKPTRPQCDNAIDDLVNLFGCVFWRLHSQPNGRRQQKGMKGSDSGAQRRASGLEYKCTGNDKQNASCDHQDLEYIIVMWSAVRDDVHGHALPSQ